MTGFDDESTTVDPTAHWTVIVLEAASRDYETLSGRRPRWDSVLALRVNDPDFLVSCDGLGFSAPQVYYEQWECIQRSRFPSAAALMDLWGVS